jgi:hypothetical protein
VINWSGLVISPAPKKMKRKTLPIIVAAFIACGATAFPIDVVITNVFPRAYMNLLFAVELGAYVGVGALLLSNLVMRQKFADVGYILAGLK